VKAARGVDAPAVEFATAALVDLPPRERRDAYTMLGDASRLAAKLRVSAGVGGGLDLAALGAVLEAAPSLEWVSAGRGLVERALLVGLERAVRIFASASGVRNAARVCFLGSWGQTLFPRVPGSVRTRQVA
jgi:pyridoxine 5'-phosphate synthase PdxJ